MHTVKAGGHWGLRKEGGLQGTGQPPKHFQPQNDMISYVPKDPVRRKIWWQRNPIRAKCSPNWRIKIPRLRRRWGSRKDTGKERKACEGAVWGQKRPPQGKREGREGGQIAPRSDSEAWQRTGGETLHGRALGSRPRSLYRCRPDGCVWRDAEVSEEVTVGLRRLRTHKAGVWNAPPSAPGLAALGGRTRLRLRPAQCLRPHAPRGPRRLKAPPRPCVLAAGPPAPAFVLLSFRPETHPDGSLPDLAPHSVDVPAAS